MKMSQKAPDRQLKVHVKAQTDRMKANPIPDLQRKTPIPLLPLAVVEETAKENGHRDSGGARIGQENRIEIIRLLKPVGREIF